MPEKNEPAKLEAPVHFMATRDLAQEVEDLARKWGRRKSAVWRLLAQFGLEQYRERVQDRPDWRPS